MLRVHVMGSLAPMINFVSFLFYKPCYNRFLIQSCLVTGTKESSNEMFTKIRNLLNPLAFLLVIAISLTSPSHKAIAVEVTCWAGKESQDNLDCCIAWSSTLSADQMKERYAQEGYGQSNPGGKYWDCQENWGWATCTSYYNQEWTGNCQWDPVEWKKNPDLTY